MQENITPSNDEIINTEKLVEQTDSTYSVQEIQQFLASTNFEYQPTQPKISLPLIQRYVKMLKDGSEAPGIKIDDGSIVDGHHRYISGCIYEKKPSIVPGTKAPSIPALKWTEVIVEEADYGQGYDEPDYKKN